jgi:hypothetical protein
MGLMARLSRYCYPYEAVTAPAWRRATISGRLSPATGDLGVRGVIGTPR